MSDVKAPANSIFIENPQAAKAIKNLFVSARLEHLENLKEAFSTDDDAPAFKKDDQEDDRTITADEFVTLTSDKGELDKPLDKNLAAQLFTELQAKFGPSISSAEVVPFWKMAVEGAGIKDIALQAAINQFLEGSYQSVVEKEDLEVPGSGKVGTVEIERRSVPKGSKIPGMALNDKGKGAWRTVHRLKAHMELDTKNFKLTMDDLIRLVSRPDKYFIVLALSLSGKQLTAADFKDDPKKEAIFNDITCSNLYYSTFGVPLNDNGYDVICMEPPQEENGRFVRNKDGKVVMEWFTSGPSKDGSKIYDFNDLAPGGKPKHAGHTWGRWEFWEEDGKIMINYETILDMPTVDGSNAGTGGEGVGLLDWGANLLVGSATTSLLNDTVKMGFVFEKIIRHLASKGADTSYASATQAMESFYQPLKTKDANEIIKVMPARVDYNLTTRKPPQ